MRYAVIVFVDTSQTPASIAAEIVSNLEFDGDYDVIAVTVLTEDGKQVHQYEKEST